MTKKTRLRRQVSSRWLGALTITFAGPLLAFLGIALLLLDTAAQAAQLPLITDLRVGLHPQSTRLVLVFDKAIEFRIFSLDAPERVVIDMPEVGWRLPARPLPEQTGLLDSLRYGLFKPGMSRIVLDLAGPAEIARAYILDPTDGHPYRLVLDLKTTSARTFALRSGAANTRHVASPTAPKLSAQIPKAEPAAPKETTSERFPRPKPKPVWRSKKRIVVLDPGHGGVDPGAIGSSGIYEKKITLAMAKKVRDLLLADGRYSVFLTRDSDRFIRLRDRVAFARDNGADLFISLHADTIKKKNVRGLSVYTLSERASDTEAAQLAEKENKADLIAGIDLTGESNEVTNILIDLAQRESMNQSAQAAKLLVGDLARETKLLRNTHRFAGFAVLKAPDVPSILIELGFLSNREDERALRQPAYQKKLARAIARGVDRYFSNVEEASRR